MKLEEALLLAGIKDTFIIEENLINDARLLIESKTPEEQISELLEQIQDIATSNQLDEGFLSALAAAAGVSKQYAASAAEKAKVKGKELLDKGKEKYGEVSKKVEYDMSKLYQSAELKSVVKSLENAQKDLKAFYIKVQKSSVYAALSKDEQNALKAGITSRLGTLQKIINNMQTKDVKKLD